MTRNASSASPLQLSILPPAQRQLWPELSQLPEEFVLYGGTAIALQLGHRQSVDFDFFARMAFDGEPLLALPLLSDAETLQREPNTLTVRVDREGPVLLSFFGLPRLPLLRQPFTVEDPCLRIADLLELGGMKAMLVQKRAEAKDYQDLHALLMLAGFDLAELLAAARFLYGPAYAPELSLKALCHYDDGNLAGLDEGIRRDLRRAVRACDPLSLPAL